MRILFGWPGFVAVVAAVQGVSVVDAARTGASFLPGDCVYYAAAAESLVRDGDLGVVARG